MAAHPRADALVQVAAARHRPAMRSVSADARVRLYFVGDGEGQPPQTLLYGTLAEAIALAHAQPDEVQVGLFLQTDNDVIAWTDFAGG